MNKPKKNRDWLIIAIFILICSITWVATNAYHGYVNRKAVVIRKELLTPLQIEIDQSLFDILKDRVHLNQEQLTEILSSSQIVPITPTPSVITEPEESPTPPVQVEETFDNQ